MVQLSVSYSSPRVLHACRQSIIYHTCARVYFKRIFPIDSRRNRMLRRIPERRRGRLRNQTASVANNSKHIYSYAYCVTETLQHDAREQLSLRSSNLSSRPPGSVTAGSISYRQLGAASFSRRAQNEATASSLLRVDRVVSLCFMKQLSKVSLLGQRHVVS
jgi:hypothetical protein